MKLLSFSLDSHILEKDSVVAIRNARYGEVLEQYAILVPSADEKKVVLSPKVTVYGTGGSIKVVQLVRLFLKASKLIKAEQFDVITSQDTYFLGLLGVILSFWYHTGLEIQVLGIEKLSFFRKKLSQYTLQRAGSIRVLSNGLRQILINEFGIGPDRMHLVPIYVDVSSLGFNTSELAGSQKKELEEHIQQFKAAYAGLFNIVSVNRLVPVKNIPMQLQVIKELSATFPNILLHIVGDGPLLDEIKQEIKELGIEKHVIMHGYKSGIALSPFFTASDCFILTSHSEGYGMVVIEAATAGLPIVMTDVGCAGEVIRNEKSGIIVSPRDTRACVEALTKIITSPSFRQQLSSGALQAIAELPSFDMVLEKYVASWQQALENKF